jgi:hypothetical protein
MDFKKSGLFLAASVDLNLHRLADIDWLTSDQLIMTNGLHHHFSDT